MSVFDCLAGQAAVRAQLEKAAAAARALATEVAPESEDALPQSAMSQAWLFTGPPGSGRSVAALALAAALECTGETPGCGECHACRTTMARSNPDVEIVETEGVTITVDATRSLVGRSYVAPSGRWRVIVIEDADRMLERTTNVLLKAIEEPPPFTVWMLCTPSPEDVMPTIRSRCRSVSLAIPPVEAVADLLVSSDHVSREQALAAAQEAQSHIGRARALATDPEAAKGRTATLRIASSIRGAGDAVLGAARLMKAADEYAKIHAAERDESERAELARSLGVNEQGRIPPAVRAQFRELEGRQKRRVTRVKRDFLDRAMIDILSFFRDVVVTQIGASVDLVNADFSHQIEAVAGESTVEQSIRKMDAIAVARERLAGNVDPLLAVEAMLVSLRPQG